MSHSNETKSHARDLARPNWSAVFAVAFCVACLITVEFLPVSLLTPMALDLGISKGMAGQSVTTTAFVAMFSSLFITSVIGKTDRRYVVILFSLLLTFSCLLVSFADSFTLLLLGRACLGGARRLLGNVGLAYHASGADARGAESAIDYFRRGINRAGDRRPVGQFPWRAYRLAQRL